MALDPLMGKALELQKELQEKAGAQLKSLGKVKAAVALLKDDDEDTSSIDEFIEVAETMLKDITKRQALPKKE